MGNTFMENKELMAQNTTRGMSEMDSYQIFFNTSIQYFLTNQLIVKYIKYQKTVKRECHKAHGLSKNIYIKFRVLEKH